MSSRFRSLFASLVLGLLITACAPASEVATNVSTTALTSTISTATLPLPSATESPTIARAPSRTPNPFPDPVLKVTGQEEVVFDWTTDRCENVNLPDLPSRAFRGADGKVQFILSHFISYRMIGPDLNDLEVDCTPIFSSDYDADPSLFTDAEWLAAPYTEDGQTIYALVHNEYQGHTHPGQCPQNDYFLCWYNTITTLVSSDGGKSYDPIEEPPGHFVAGLPYPYKAGAGTYGLRNPSNVIEGPDGYFYVFMNYIAYQTQQQWVCLMRTQTLADPTSWRYWDGEGFGGQFLDPYLNAIANPEASLCAPLASDQIGASLNESITYNTVLDRYVLIGISADNLEGREVWGFFYSFSTDLIHWSRRKLLLEITLPWTAANFDDVMYLYPSLLDPQSESRNFETTGKTAYLYYTRLNFGQGSLDRDLIRVAVELFPSETEAKQVTPVPTSPTKPPVTLSILKKDFTVPGGTPIELSFIWESQTAEQTAEYLDNLTFDVLLDGEPLPDVMDYWGGIMAEGNGRYSSQWLYPLGVLSSGSHVITIKMTLSKPVSDGLGYTYSGVFFENTIQINVGS